MVEFSNREDVERWLRGKPRDIAMVIAARALLRVVPLLANALGGRGGAFLVKKDIVIPVLHAASIALDAIHGGAGYAGVRGALSYFASSAAAFDVAFVARAAADTLDAVHARDSVPAAADAISATAAAGRAAGVALNSNYGAVSGDANASERGMTTISLARSGLWPRGVPEWAKNNWSRLKEALLSLDDNWEVWTSWYEARRDGFPANEALEAARVRIVENFQHRGSSVMNAEMKLLMEKYGTQRLLQPDATSQLVEGWPEGEVRAEERAYHGIFMSHTHADKPFVRRLRDDLLMRGVPRVWIDEAEINIGDSLSAKIEEGMKETRYIGVVLSTRSIRAPWVKKELDIAMNREIASGDVVVLPLLYEKCELPTFLEGKLYADFTEPNAYDEALAKLLRRLRISIS